MDEAKQQEAGMRGDWFKIRRLIPYGFGADNTNSVMAGEQME